MSLKKANERLVENLLLFDPVTERGRDRLYELGLENEITPEIFFSGPNKFWVPPAKLAELPLDEELDYDSSPNGQRIKGINERREQFNNRFKGKSQPEASRKIEAREFTLLMGVVGSGKSMELQQQIYTNYHGIPFSFSKATFRKSFEKTMLPNVVYIDLEHVNVEINVGNGYRCIDSSNALNLFFTKLLATLIYYIKFLFDYHNDALKSVKSNYTKWNPDSKKYTKLFDALFNYSTQVANFTLGTVFDLLLDVIGKEANRIDPTTGKPEDPMEARIRIVLDLLGLIMSGANFEADKCIVIDNVEDFIKVSGTPREIAISLDHAKTIYDTILNCSEAIKDTYINAEKTSSFHYVMALRRTTWKNLESRFAGNEKALVDDMFDLTGDISLSDLWEKKAFPIWEKYLKSQYDEAAQNYIKHIDNLLRDAGSRNSIHARFSRLMSHGLRREGHSLSESLYDMFFGARHGLALGDSNQSYLRLADYCRLFSDAESVFLREAIFLRRSSVVELYLKRALASTDERISTIAGKRWRDLNVGKITGIDVKNLRNAYYYSYGGTRRMEGGTYKPISRWDYQFNGSNMSNQLLRRVLTELNRQPEGDQASRCVAPLYHAISFLDLIHTTLGESPDKEQLLSLSTMLLAGARPDVDAEFSPLFLFQDGVDYEDSYRFKSMLDDVLNAGPAGSADGEHTFCRQKHGIRITEAGADFLHNIQPSFEYFSALFCNEFPPLLFIKSPEVIEHVIGGVYGNAVRVCMASSIHSEGPVLISSNNWEYAECIQKLHMQYLHHYCDFIRNCGQLIGLPEPAVGNISRSVETVIGKYSSWKEKSGA